MRLYLLSVIFTVTALSSATAQETDVIPSTVQPDSLVPVADPHYREDQFYATISYNLLTKLPDGYQQYSFSTGITTGFLRDIPLNKARNRGVALGFGYSYNNIKHNLVVQQGAEAKSPNVYSLRNDYETNKLVLHYLEVPLELRWRNSDSVSHKFWRVYAGFKVSYLLYDKAQYEPTEGGVFKVRNDAKMNKWIYGAYIAGGWNTWNFYGYYGFTPLYKDAYTDSGRQVDIHTVQLGLIFYIL